MDETPTQMTQSPLPLWGRVRVGVKRQVKDPVSRARNLRAEATDAEKLLWSHLRRHQMLGYQFRRQEPIGKYIADFVCYRKRLVIELDGGQHIDQLDYDSERSRWLETRGFRVVRFWNEDVLSNAEGVLSVIALFLEDAS